jgi:fluoroquinolone transport system permease protein
VLGFARADARFIAREPLLALALALPLFSALLLRYGWNPIGGLFLGARVEQYRPAAASVLLLVTPMMVGAVVGFVLLDEREEGVLATIATTPFGKRGLVLYRVVIPVVAVLLLSPLLTRIAFDWTSGPFRLMSIVLLAALQAPVMTLFLPAFASNRIEGLALAKAASLLIVPALAPLATGWVRWLGAPFPPFWVTTLVLERDAGAVEFAGLWLAGAAMHGAAMLWMLRRFLRRAE